MLPDSGFPKALLDVGVDWEVKMFDVDEGVGIQLAAISWVIKALFFCMFRLFSSGRFFSLPRNVCKGCVVGMGLGRLDMFPFS